MEYHRESTTTKTIHKCTRTSTAISVPYASTQQTFKWQRFNDERPRNSVIQYGLLLSCTIDTKK